MLPKLLFFIFLSINTSLGSKHTPIKLDVGGTIFKTTKHTLTKNDGLFKTMFEAGHQPQKDDNGCVFIDRSPKHFDLILTYLRDGFVTISNHEHLVREIVQEAEYYKLDGLKKLCTAKILELSIKEQVTGNSNPKEVVVETRTIVANTAANNTPSLTVTLNVGGTVFETRRTTLVATDGLLKDMLGEGDDVLFIDRDPKHFHHVLNFLRNNYTYLPTKYEEIQDVLDEAEYFKLEEMAEYCEDEMAATMRFIEDDKHYLKVLMERGQRILIFHFIMANVQLNYDLAGFDVKKILQTYHEKIDIYFRPVPLNADADISFGITKEGINDTLWTLIYNGEKEIHRKGYPNMTFTEEVEDSVEDFLMTYPIR